MATAIRINGNHNGNGHHQAEANQNPPSATLHSSPSDNLAIWNAVEKTDPAHTKPFSRAGGFKGTAVDPTYRVKRATEIFGPIGIGWGFSEVEHFIADGAEGDKIWFSKVRLWFIHNSERGEVEQWGATTFVGRNSKGVYSDEEAGKKSITDAVGKCLSLLGFSADVHLGLYDDQKYVNDRRQEEARKKARPASNGHVAAASCRRAPDGASNGGQVFDGRGNVIGNGHAQTRRDAAPTGPVTGEHLLRPRGSATAHPHAVPAGRPDQYAAPATRHPSPATGVPTDLADFLDLSRQATMINDVMRAAEQLRRSRALSDVELSLLAVSTDAARDRIHGSRGANSNR